MTPNETEAFAALRMHVAHLVNALTVARMGMEQRLSVDAHVAANGPTFGRIIDAALEQSEPAVKDLLAEADRDAKLNACREQLAETTARLAVIERSARQVTAALAHDNAQPVDVPFTPSLPAALADLAAVLP